MIFRLADGYIELYKLLKVVNLVATGGHGKMVIENGEVVLNGEVEYRKRAKIRKGDKISFNNHQIDIE
jgi:ribosome-associated protein